MMIQYKWKRLDSPPITIPKGRDGIGKLLRRRIVAAFNAQNTFLTKLLWEDPPYRGKTGPKTFTGTPDEVVRAFRKWQRDDAPF